MAITITIDNDSVTSGIQPLVNDQSSGTQTPASPDTGNDSNVDITDATVASGATPDSNLFDGTLSGANYSAAFLSFLNGATIFGSAGLRLNDTQKAFAANVDGAVSSSSFVTVTASAGETISNLLFSDSSGNALAGQQVAGMHTLDGGNVYLWSNGDFAIATSGILNGAPAGRVVAAFYLNEAANHLSAQVQMVTFEPLQHPDAGNPDDALNFTDVLQVSAQGTMSFNFDNLPSGSFLYAAVGNSSAGLLVTGQDLNVTPTGAKAGDMITGGTDPSDTVNTSQGGIGATIGINSQHFTDAQGGGGSRVDGAVGVFTLVKGFTSFDATVNGTSEGTGGNVNEIGYTDFVNAPSAKIFISQVTGSSSIGGAVKVTLWEAGGGGSADHLTSQLKPEEGLTDTANSYSYIGDTATDSHLRDDTPVVVGSVSITRGANTYTFSGSGGTQAGITVAISSNGFTVTGLITSDTIGFAAANDPNNALDGTFNRFDVQALANSNPVDIGRIDLDQGVSVSHSVGDQLVVQDDGPAVAPTLVTDATVSVDESLPSTTPTIDTGAIVKGDDPDLAGGIALGFGTSGSAVVNPHAVFGTDGPAASSSLTYALSLGNVTSGLKLTDGTAINLQQLANGNIVGVVASGTFSGQAAFAISINSTTGVVTVEQYLSLQHGTADTNGDSDEAVQANLNTIGVTVTATDGDGDHVTSSVVDISHQISFHDDGPTASPSLNANATVSVDESLPSTTPTIDTGTIVKGDDPDLAGGIALGFATSGSAVVNAGAVFGADGPATSGSISYALALGPASAGLTLTDGTAISLQQIANGNIVGVVQGSGTFAGQAAFAIAINSSTGVVTVEQYLSLHHGSADTNGDSNEAVQAALNSIGVTVTATDGDGDSYTSSAVDISHLISFHDDGPTASPSLNANATVSVDESLPSTAPTIDTGTIIRGDDPDLAGGIALGFATSGSAVVNAGAVFGADGPATSGSISYALALGPASAGLTLTDGTAISLQQIANGNIVGVVQGSGTFAGQAAFAISINASSGVVTVEQYLSLHHGSPDAGTDSDEAVTAALNSIGVTVTATDGDGASYTSSAVDISHQISFHDDGPTMTASSQNAPSITDDETNLGTNNTGDYSANFTAVFGADGPASTARSYSLSTPGGASGLIESGTGLQVFLFQVGNTIVGKSGTTALTAASGTTVFVVSIDQNGVVTLDQQRAVVHDPNTGVDQSTTLQSAGLVVVNATAFDGDGDSASDSLNIGQLLNFKDDAPTITSQIQDGEVAFTQNASVSNSLNGAIGADGTSSTQTSLSGTAEYTISYWDTTPTNVYPHLNAVLSNSGTVLTYYSDTQDTNAVYRLTLDPLGDSGHGTYTFQVLQPPPIVSSNFAFTDLPSGQNLDGVIATDKADLTKGGLLVFPSNPVLNPDGTFTNTSGTINTSKGGGPVTIGNGNQAFDSPQEGAYFMYVDNPAASSVGGLGLTQTSADDADTINFNGLNESTDSSVSIVQASGMGTAKRPGPSIHIATWEAPLNTAVNSNSSAEALVNNPVVATSATEVSIVGIKIHDSTGKVVEYGVNNNGTTQLQDVTGDGLVNGADNVGSLITFINDNLGGTAVWSANVTQLRAGYTIEFLTASSHNIALVQNVSGSFDIGGFSASNQVTVPAQTFHFAATITDYDNDSYGGHLATFADWTVTIDSVVP
jgi:hypothetical protein